MRNRRQAVIAWAAAVFITALSAPQLNAEENEAASKPKSVHRFGSFRFRFSFDPTVFAFSPDGKRIAAGGLNGVAVMDKETGKILRQFANAPVRVRTVAFSADGKTLFAAGRTPIYWDVKSGKAINAKKAGKKSTPLVIRYAAVSADRKWVAFHLGEKIEIRRWGAPSGQSAIPIERFTTQPTLTSDGRLIAFAYRTDGNRKYGIRIWDREKNRKLRDLPAGEFPVRNLAFAPDGRSLYCTRFNAAVEVWNLKTGQAHSLFEAEGNHGSFHLTELSPDGKTLAVVTRTPMELLLIDTTTGKTRQRISDFPRRITAMAFSPDGQSFVTNGHFSALSIGDVARGTVHTQVKDHEGRVQAMAVSNDGRRLATIGVGGYVCVWNVHNRQLVTRSRLRFSGSMLGASLQFLPGDRHVAILAASSSLTNGVKIWDVKSNRIVGEFPADPTTQPFAVAPDGSYAQGAEGGVINFFEPPESRLTPRPKHVALVGHTGRVTALAISPDGSRLASAGTDNTLRFWDLKKRRAKGKPVELTAPVTGLLYSGKALLAVVSDDSVELREVKSGKTRTIIRTAIKEPRALAFSSDGKRLAIAGGQRIELWDTKKGQRIGQITVPSQQILSLAFSPDGDHLAVGTGDSKIPIVDLSTKKVRTTLSGHADSVSKLLFFSDRELASGSASGQVFTWNLRKPDEPLTKRYFSRVVGGVHDMVLSKDGYLTVVAGYRAFMRFEAANRNDRGETKKVLGDGRARDFGILAGKNAIVVFFTQWSRAFDLASGREIDVSERIRYAGHRSVLVDDSAVFLPGKPGLVEWDPKSGKELLRIPAKQWGTRSFALGITPQGRLSALIAGREPAAWNLKTNTEVFHVPAREWGTSMFLGTTSDCSMAASSMFRPKELRLWNTDTGRIIRKIPVSDSAVRYAQLSPDGLVLTMYDRGKQAVVIMELISGQITLRHPVSLTPTFSRSRSMTGLRMLFLDGTTLLAAGDDGTVLAMSLKPEPHAKQSALPKLWKELTASKGAAAYRAHFAMAESGDRAVEFLEKRLKPAGRSSAASPRDLWAVHVLRRVGTPAAVRVLKSLADGDPSAELTLEARRAIRLLRPPKK